MSKNQTSEQGRNRLLIVEDFDGIRNSVARYFERNGYAVTSAGTSRDAVILAETEHPHVIFVDLDMRFADAIRTISLIHTAVPTSYIVLLAGKPSIALEEKAKAAGAATVIEKPFDSQMLETITSSASNMQTA